MNEMRKMYLESVIEMMQFQFVIMTILKSYNLCIKVLKYWKLLNEPTKYSTDVKKL